MKNWQHNYVCGFFINAISGRWHRLHLYGFEASSIAANCVSLIQFLRYRAERHCCQHAVRGNIIIRCEWKLRISSLLVLPASLFLLLLLRFFVLFFKKSIRRNDEKIGSDLDRRRRCRVKIYFNEREGLLRFSSRERKLDRAVLESYSNDLEYLRPLVVGHGASWSYTFHAPRLGEYEIY